jgi:CRP-like cAMP-binding protein
MLIASPAMRRWAADHQAIRRALAVSESIMPEQNAIFANCLLHSLSEPDLRLLRPRLEPVELKIRQQLEGAHGQIRFVYFLESGFACMVARNAAGKEAEVGMIGREGMSGIGLVLGDEQSTHDVLVHMQGKALRVPVNDMRSALSESETLRMLLLRYARALWIQTAYTALANAQTRLDARLARWLLMVRDRVDSDSFEITHEFMAFMLAVRRPGVTVALHELEGKGLIKSLRGVVIIRDRAGLMELADGTYTLPELEYERLIGTRILHPAIGLVS